MSKYLSMNKEITEDGVEYYAIPDASMSLTKRQAIKRIQDIEKGLSVDHITDFHFRNHYLLNDCERGAVNELMAIFDIKEDELK